MFVAQQREAIEQENKLIGVSYSLSNPNKRDCVLQIFQKQELLTLCDF